MALIAAGRAVLQGSKDGLAEINKLRIPIRRSRETARTAGEMLMNTRHYALGADFLQVGAAGDNAAQTMGLASMLRGAKRHEDLKFANTPTDLVKRVFLLTMDPNANIGHDGTDLRAVMPCGFPRRRFLTICKKELTAGKKLNSQMARQDNSLDVTIDILLQAVDPKGDGDDTTGIAKRCKFLAGRPSRSS